MLDALKNSILSRRFYCLKLHLIDHFERFAIILHIYHDRLRHLQCDEYLFHYWEQSVLLQLEQRIKAHKVSKDVLLYSNDNQSFDSNIDDNDWDNLWLRGRETQVMDRLFRPSICTHNVHLSHHYKFRNKHFQFILCREVNQTKRVDDSEKLGPKEIVLCSGDDTIGYSHNNLYVLGLLHNRLK